MNSFGISSISDFVISFAVGCPLSRVLLACSGCFAVVTPEVVCAAEGIADATNSFY